MIKLIKKIGESLKKRIKTNFLELTYKMIYF